MSEEVFDLFLLGFFTEFIEEVKDKVKPEKSLLKICYLDSLLELNRFDEYYEQLMKISDPAEKDLLTFYFKLFTFDFMPSYYYSKFAKSKDYSIEFKELSKNFYKYVNKNLDSPYFHFIKLNICYEILSIISTFFNVYKYPLNEYIRIRIAILNSTKKIESKYLSDEFLKTEEENIWKALIFDWIGSVYSFYNTLKHKERFCYEKSISYKFNIFALTDLLDLIKEDENEDVKNYLKTAELSWNFYKSIEETEYHLYFRRRAELLEREDKRKAEKNYYRAIDVIEKKIKYKTIAESYSYYNLALIKEEIEKYQIAEECIRKALEILQKATNININENFSEELLYFLEDFQDYLYEKCKIQIFQDKKENYNNTLKILNLICEKVNKLEYYNLRASLEYDIALLKSKIYDSQKKYDNMIEYLEKCLDKEENYLSDEQKADLRARLAYGYYKISKFEKYYENINKSIELDSSNETALKLISQPKKYRFKVIQSSTFYADRYNIAHVSICNNNIIHFPTNNIRQNNHF
ncbi:tetratricopeptide repeat protein [Thermodesulfovibrio yellowstonii]|uniref:tetratricopeptide repeat protein n=1 Tax=Thermodesulfovibrio yellowstonii TaxID=28262 RepID=UPI0003F81A75|nr:tetratricopeptide repeat protein [Thermodesulfovibrio islandicus]